MMTESTHDKFDQLAQRVLAEYDLDRPAVAFIHHSDTVTYQVTSSGSKYLLRIHIPVTTSLGLHGTNYDMVHSEITWLMALTQDTGLPLQKPVRNRTGELVTRLPAEDGTFINSTLLHWIEGELYHRDLETKKTAFQIGALLARLHDHASGWQVPDDFIRPKRDIAYFRQVLVRLQPAVGSGLVSPQDYKELSRSTSLLIEIMRELDQSPDTYGIMHADAHKGNMIINAGNIHLIDFSFCAFGNFMFDLGICLSDMKPELHASCLKGYRSLRDLPENYQQLIEGFFLGSVIGTFSFWVANPNNHEILFAKVPQIVNQFAKKFNQDERFWFGA